jgi:hypothetical protein
MYTRLHTKPKPHRYTCTHAYIQSLNHTGIHVHTLACNNNQKKRKTDTHVRSTTAKLVNQCLGVDEKYIKAYELGESAHVCGAQVTFLDANHCPGAALLLFQLQDGSIHLHTGDMRARKEMQQYPQLAAVRGKIDKVCLSFVCPFVSLLARMHHVYACKHVCM